MKIPTKKKKLIIKNNQLIKEGWADVAASQATDGSWTKVAQVALKGTWEAFKGTWNTGVVLPVKLLYNIRNPARLKEVMKEWERYDSKIKESQRRINSSTGVEGTVDAFVGLCNPSALAMQKWNEYTVPEEYKDLTKTYATRAWNKTAGKLSKDLVIDEEQDSDKINTQIAYANFILAISKKVLKINIQNQTYLSSYSDYKKQKSSTSFAGYIDPTDKVSRSSKSLKTFIEYMEKDLFNNKQVKRSGSNFQKYVDDNIGKEKFNEIKELLFKNIKKSNGVTITNAAGIVLSNNLTSEINDLTRFIRDADGLFKAFKAYKNKKNITQDEEQEVEEKSAPAPEPEAEETIKAAGVLERLNKKKTLGIKNKSLVLLEKVDNNIDKKALEKIFKKGSEFYLDHLLLLTSTRYVIAIKVSLLKKAYVYSLYSNFSENISSGNYVIQDNELSTGVKNSFNKLVNLSKSIVTYLEKQEVKKSLIPDPNSSLVKIEKQIFTQGLNDSEIKSSLQSSINLDSKENADKILDSFASNMGVSKEELLKDLQQEDVNQIYRNLNSAAFFSDMISGDNEELTTGLQEQEQEVQDAINLYNQVSSKTNTFRSKDKFEDVFKKITDFNAVECLKVIDNIDEYESTTDAITKFKNSFEAGKVNTILREKEKELEEVLQIGKTDNTDEEETTEDGFKFTPVKGKFTDSVIVSIESDEGDET